jgi:hypothetical protein
MLELKNKSTMKIYKYHDIFTCLDDIKSRHISILNKSNYLNIDPKSNFFHYVNEGVLFQINILFYFDWFPHIQWFNLLTNDHDLIPVFYYLLQENTKFNARNWNIFHNFKKMNIDFNESLILLIQKNDRLKKYFLTLEQKKLFRCDFCCNSNIQKISSDYSICKNKTHFNVYSAKEPICQNFKLKK